MQQLSDGLHDATMNMDWNINVSNIKIVVFNRKNGMDNWKLHMSGKKLKQTVSILSRKNTYKYEKTWEISGCANDDTKIMANFWCEEWKFFEVKQKEIIYLF